MKPNLDNITEKTKNVRLSSAEKFDMLNDLRAYADSKPARSPYQSVWFRQAFAVYASAFILVVATGATSFAAEQALPGDALYGIKTNINEGVVRTLPLPAATKAKVEISMIDRRMGELEKMIVTERDTPENVEMLMKRIGDHKDEFDVHVDELEDTSAGSESDEIHAELETVVDAHIVVLEEITSDDEPDDTSVEPEAPNAPEPETVADEPMFASEPANESSDEAADTSMMMTMQLKVAEPVQRVATIQPKVAVMEEVDPILEEVTEFSLTEIKPFANSADDEQSSEDERESLRERIFRRAEKQLNIDIESFGESILESGVKVNI